MAVLTREFYARSTLAVARELVGKKLVRQLGDHLLSRMISETEAYGGAEDSASHAFRGRTHRNAVMFGPPGKAYVYLVYGKHHMLNIVTEPEGRPGAVLLRALVPLEGREHMEHLRGRRGKWAADGPGKLCLAMSIDGRLNEKDLTVGEDLWLEEYMSLPPESLSSGPRVGIDYAKPADRLAPWRFRMITAA